MIVVCYDGPIPIRSGVYMKELTVRGPSSFMLCCVRWPDMAVIEKAADGTIFFDEIGDLNRVSQIKLLRLLQEGTYYPLGPDHPGICKARIITAANKNSISKEKASDAIVAVFIRIKRICRHDRFKGLGMETALAKRVAFQNDLEKGNVGLDAF